MRRLCIALAVPAIMAAAPVAARPTLVAATPAADAVVPATDRVQLGFSEPLVAAASGAAIEMTDMPGMKMKAPMKMPLETGIGPDGRTLLVTLARPLPRGTYRIDWHAGSADGGRATGAYRFKVR